jgi:cysteinyl-tRNA synthetase
MDDDLNTAAALATLFELARPLRSLANRQERGDAAAAAEAALPLSVAQAALLRELAAVLGLRQEAASTAGPAEAGASDAGPGDAEIEALIEARRAAKASRDYASADRIRDGLRAQGIELIDRPGGVTEWLRG